eukprot:TRINITY_DN1245_c0_g2_i1.p1 TRINITY_DN1245_c0_g2~~TRINITY_DN1245_c0_g2_i1.p1  ORF type:complete len:476 (-),score=154.27 TRINITY_DN1245_c0_g2_i1:137-1465(-)
MASDGTQQIGEEELSQYDLTRKMAPFLDRHLIVRIFPFLLETGMYKSEDLDRAEIALLSQTNMIDFAKEKLQALGDDIPEELDARRDQVLEQLSNARDRSLPLLQILEDEEQVKKIASFKTMAELCKEFQLEPDAVDVLVHYAKLQYDCGNYAFSSEVLKHVRSIIANQESDTFDASKNVSCIWGALASHLLNSEIDEAAAVILQLDEFLESGRLAKKEVMIQRTWLLHWTLFAIFTPQKGDSKLLDFLLNDKNLVVITLTCPHLFRYVSASLILHKRLKHLIKDTVKILRQESGSYSDPITRFLLALYSDMDFDQAQTELQKCANACKADFFLKESWAEFEENARLLIFETYCRIHQCINIGMIARKLNMQEEEAELWIVKLIQSAKLDARIDCERSRVVMSKGAPNVYQQVIDKTKNLSFRSTMLLSNLEKAEKEAESNK